MRTIEVCLAILLLAASAPLAAQAGDSPLSAGEHTVEVDGLSLSYKVAGSGPVAILPTPGWGPSHEYLSLSLQPLETLFTMVYLDTRGSGRSQVPDAPFAAEELVSDLDGVRRALGRDKVWLVGHSMGGAQIVEYALRHPTHVNGLITLAGSVSYQDPDPVRQKAYIDAMVAEIETRRDRPGFDKAYAAWTSTTPLADDEALAAMQMDTLPIVFYDAGKAKDFGQAFERTRFSLAAFKLSDGWQVALEPRLHEVAVPTLVVGGLNDPLVPVSQTYILHRGIPGSKLLLVPESGHMPWMEQPELFHRGIRESLPGLGYDPSTQ